MNQGFVDLFKKCDIFSSKNKAETKGSTLNTQCKEIGRRVVKISGNVSTSNFLKIGGMGKNALMLSQRYVRLDCYRSDSPGSSAASSPSR